MAKREVYDCDNCGKSAPIHLYLCVGRSPDGSGSNSNDCESLDLCDKCATALIHQIVDRSPGYDLANKVIKEWKKRS